MSERPTLVKCLVWDLDNTLWKGTLSEDDRVWLPEEIREIVAELDSRGILQSIASKNDFAPAWERLEELGIAEYFVLPRIGWGPKSASVAAVADRLRFAQGTIAFIDDQPTERAEVSHHLPEVRCYAAEDALKLPGLAEFSPDRVTVDSAQRRRMYQANFRREAEQAEFKGPDEEFLRTLDIAMDIGRAGDEEISRVEELTLRTSQMNATGVHYPDSALRELMDDPDHEVLTVTMRDRFGPHGAVGVVLLKRLPGLWNLKLLATSCRVVSFGAGAAILGWLSDQAARAGVHIAADFRRTERNRMMEVAYRFAGYEEADCTCAASALPTPAEAVQRLHLRPERQEPTAVIRLTAVDLAGAGKPTPITSRTF
ncbi:HAD-IIIC family phosphatase [Nocardiopsis dassonvillei]|uniref:HAD-IIIC family phosphatase n=1 Tax=Nocardiopsis dassonvillei TaxID=2014 RepID=UPI000B9D7952|nr:HAD-IIIC family phosphatase [Nocardiopsis dassonvillei]ASU58188.1 hypothetical protein CGQ36_11775 [Nocardiopsis dassonvillei]